MNEKEAMGLSGAGVLVEYVGDRERPITAESEFIVEDQEGRRLDFAPKPEYDNRRIEAFPSEPEALEFMRSQRKDRRDPHLYRIANDLITVAEKTRFQKVIREALKPLEARIKNLEDRLGPPGSTYQEEQAEQDPPPEDTSG